VVLTRTDNSGWGPCIDERAAIANRAGADVALSIHGDGGPSSGRGFHVIYPPSLPGLTDDIAAASRRLALDVRAAYAQGTGVPYATYIGVDGLDERRDLGGLNLSDATDARLIEDPAFRDRVARALMVGIRAFVDGR
jgi:N-acetylmuramoyl-L-alanine amidase